MGGEKSKRVRREVGKEVKERGGKEVEMGGGKGFINLIDQCCMVEKENGCQCYKNRRFTKKERLSSQKRIDRLFDSGESGFVYPFRYLYIIDQEEEKGAAKKVHSSKEEMVVRVIEEVAVGVVGMVVEEVLGEMMEEIIGDAGELVEEAIGEVLNKGVEKVESKVEHIIEQRVGGDTERETQELSDDERERRKREWLEEEGDRREDGGREKKVQERGALSILISIPKRNHKRAYRRNLLKRRTREAFRSNKHSVVEQAIKSGMKIDIALIYTAKEIEEFTVIENGVKKITQKILKLL